MDVEADRAMVWQINAESGAHKPYATGLRNPTALAIQTRVRPTVGSGKRAG
jgi:glucose/arabinose dehydrogenase